ncbi:hypothetical protein TraAM80_06209 [Trypanosoma rangeli]|uniref:Uncharacterized protein n=1 Tax=Trypanosoma rangeli TaxID=5698 RepID=A0A3R7K6T1_TRYRA|nr:uncharacterized protein TraAM80_06209 [Trypanosoma rangeli]RNF02687.1 hypothetical protein TraAM80_06209 [Trypanosoma rangeli]|eukprot:RNF02687.1 hypothetical protein TraAM80_06209 [Trypanosoma rangeli]
MYTEDKLQPMMATSTLSVPSGMQYNRPHTSLGGRIRNSFNGHRVDFSRTAYNRGSYVRHTGTFRLHSDSVTTMSVTHAYPSQDVTRYLLHANEKAQAILERFAEQMKTYHTFHPSFVEGGVYKTLMPKAGLGGGGAWDAVDKALGAFSSKAVRHNAHNSFMETVESIPSVKEQLSRKSGDPTVSRAFISDSVPPISPSVSQDKDDVLLYLWSRERLNITPDEMHQELLFRDKERANTWKLSLTSTRQRWQAEFDGLLENTRGDTPSSLMSASPSENEARAVPMELLQERAVQRIQWDVFSKGVVPSKLGPMSSLAPVPVPAAEIISDYRQNNELQTWMEGKWKHHTHRHENAALRIQCAYRCYRARLRAARRRYTRRIAFLEARRVEEESTRAWDTALRVMTDELNRTGDNFNTTWRSLNFVVAKLQAKALARRARKKAEMDSECEIKEYAALTIQRVHRGYCGRRLAKIIRFPEVFEQQRLARFQAAAVALQAAWRGSTTRARIDRQRKAVLVIQRLVRLSAARTRLRQLRAARRKEIEQLTERFAAQTLCRFLKQVILRRRERILRFRPQAEVLQRVTRGLFVRLALYRQKQSLLRLVLWTQRHFRGTLGRELAQQQREKRDALLQQLRRVDAATVVQRAWRRSVEAAARDEEMEVSENGSSNEPMVLEYSKEEAAAWVQRWYRCLCIMRQARADRDAAREQLLLAESAERILRFYRAFKVRQSFLLPQAAPTGCTPLRNL